MSGGALPPAPGLAATETREKRKPTMADLWGGYFSIEWKRRPFQRVAARIMGGEIDDAVFPKPDDRPPWGSLETMCETGERIDDVVDDTRAELAAEVRANPQVAVFVASGRRRLEHGLIV